MIDRLLVHIGTHKTGSSAIQSALSAGADRLRAAGILYPSAGQGPTGGHLNLCWEVSDDARFDPRRGGIADLIAEVERERPSVVVVSAETLTSRPRNPIYAEWVASLAARFRAETVSVVGYVRPQWDYLDSLYTQRIKKGYIGSEYDEFLRANVDHPRFDYVTTFDQWERGFGPALTLRGYSSTHLLGGDVIDDFLEAAGIENPGLTRPEVANPRPGARATELLRLLHRRLEDRGSDPRGHPRLFAWAEKWLSREFPRDPPFRGLSYPQAQELERRFGRSNELLVSRHPQLARLFRLPPRQRFPSRCVWYLDAATTAERRAAERFFDEAFERL